MTDEAAPKVFKPFRFNKQFQFRVDVSKRKSTCGMCRQLILKESTRLVIEAGTMGVPIEMKNGGRIFQQRTFLHPECLAQWSSGTENPKSYCYDCRREIGESTPYWHTNDEFGGWAYTGLRGASAGICKNCLESRRWQVCSWCGVNYPAHMVSKIVRYPDGDAMSALMMGMGMVDEVRPNRKDSQLCIFCAAESPEIITQKTATAIEREFFHRASKLKALIEDLDGHA